MFEVIVGNIGTVYSGNDRGVAQSLYGSYVLDSKHGCGRASGESVTLMQDDEPISEYIGTLNQND